MDAITHSPAMIHSRLPFTPSSLANRLGPDGLAVALHRRHLIRVQMRASSLQHRHVLRQPRSRRQIQWSVAATIAEVDRRALPKQIAKDLDVRSGCREVLQPVLASTQSARTSLNNSLSPPPSSLSELSLSGGAGE